MVTYYIQFKMVKFTFLKHKFEQRLSLFTDYQLTRVIPYLLWNLYQPFLLWWENPPDCSVLWLIGSWCDCRWCHHLGLLCGADIHRLRKNSWSFDKMNVWFLRAKKALPYCCINQDLKAFKSNLLICSEKSGSMCTKVRRSICQM